MSRKAVSSKNDLPERLQPLLEENPNILVYADIPRSLHQGLLSQNEIETIASKYKPESPEVKKAYFFESKGVPYLKLFAYTDNYSETIRLDIEPETSMKDSLFKNAIEYCRMIGFQPDTYPIDNRTELQYIEDYDEYARVTVELKKRPMSYEQWRENQILSF